MSRGIEPVQTILYIYTSISFYETALILIFFSAAFQVLLCL